MTDTATRLLDECAASPDDDAPRLAWADLVGGERGELVVLQCDLARGGWAPAELALRRQRERELLATHGAAWAGELASVASRWTFRRGFIEAARLVHEAETSSPAPFDAHPLLAGLELEDWLHATSLLDRLTELVPRLRALDLASERPEPEPDASAAYLSALIDIVAAGTAAELRAFGISHLDVRGARAVSELAAQAPLHRLRLRDHQLEPYDLARILEAAPGLVGLELTSAGRRENPLEPIADRPLRALSVGDEEKIQLETLATGRIAQTLERLALDCNAPAATDVGLRGFAGLTALRVLELGGDHPESALWSLRPDELRALRVLRVRGVVTATSLASIVERFGAQLELLQVCAPPPAPGHRAAIPIDAGLRAQLAGELHVDPLGPFVRRTDRELLHASPEAMLEGVRACFAAAPAISLTRTDHPAATTVWPIPPLPLDEPIMLGRGSHLAVYLPSGTVARLHASLRWEAGAHLIIDHGGTNGIKVNGVMVATRARLADGDELALGEITLRYRVLG